MWNRRFKAWRHLLLGAMCLSQAACLGTTIPQVQEFWGTPGDANKKVRLLVSQVTCELSRAIYRERHSARAENHALDFLDKWGVQVILELSVDEKSVLSPGASIISPLPAATTELPSGPLFVRQSFTGSIGGAYSNEAISTDMTTLFYLIKYLDKPDFIYKNCIEPKANADLFIESDLGIYEWLDRNLNLQYFNGSDLDLGAINNVLSHDVKFEIVSSANATPTWQLIRFTGDTPSPLAFASRDRFEELIITMGRESTIGGGLSEAAAASSLASQISSAIHANRSVTARR